jgi:hypothetical protein
MSGLFDRLTRSLLRQGLRRGLLEGSAAWLIVLAAVWLVRLLGRPEEPQRLTARLPAGQSILVRQLEPLSRRARKRGRDLGGGRSVNEEIVTQQTT